MTDLTDSKEWYDAYTWCHHGDNEWAMAGDIKRIEEPITHECKASCMIERSDWHYWKLSCGHIYHTRCLEMHLYYKKRLNCCLCGDLSPKNWHCNFCNEDHYEGREWNNNNIRDNECFLNSNRKFIVSDYKKKGLNYVLREYPQYYESDIKIVIDVYNKLSAGEYIDWRKELSKCIDRDWKAI